MATTREELEKLTVAQLKEKLKSRKLTITGAKSELISRLHESIVTEEKLLEDGPADGENFDLSGVNMDEVLGLDDEKDTHSAASSELASDKQLDSSLLSIGSTSTAQTEPPKAPTSAPKTSPVKIAPVKKPITMTEKKPQQVTGSSITSTDSDNKSQQSVTESEGKSADGQSEAEKKIPIAEDKKVQLKTAARLGVPLAESEAKAKRAARFGGTTSGGENNSGSEEEMKAKRAARFGTSTQSATDEESPAKRKTVTEEDGKMLQRAERFGLPLKRGAAPESSNSSTGTGGGGANEDVLLKRAKRFGMAGGGGDMDDKKLARAKRFGMA